MKGLLEGMVVIIVFIAMIHALFPQTLERIVSTTVSALFLSIVLLVVGGGIWLLVKYFD